MMTMENTSLPAGKTTIAPEVLFTIARLTTLSIPGVSKISTSPGDVNQFLKRGIHATEGVRIAIEDDAVYADIYVVIKGDVNAREVGHHVQAQVARAISEMVGMEVGRVNIHIEDIDYDTSTES
jgi:uncharacterized alkaline shock family protein YloU